MTDESDKKPNDPTAAEIRRVAKLIRKKWTVGLEMRRRGVRATDVGEPLDERPAVMRGRLDIREVG